MFTYQRSHGASHWIKQHLVFPVLRNPQAIGKLRQSKGNEAHEQGQKVFLYPKQYGSFLYTFDNHETGGEGYLFSSH